MNKHKIFNLILLLVPFGAHAQNKGIVYEDASGYISTPVNTDATLTGAGTSASPLSVVSGGGGSTPYTISPAQITSDQDNYAPTGIGKASYVRISGDNGIRAITGIADSVAGTLSKVIFNVGNDYPVYLPMEHPDSDAAHRFTGWHGDYVLHPGKSVELLYDLTSSRWRFVCAPETMDNLTAYYNANVRSVTGGDQADLSFTTISSGSVGAVAPSGSVPGYFQLSTAALATGGEVAFFTKTTNTYTSFGSSHNYVDAKCFFPTLSDGTNTFTAEIQLTSTPGSTSLEPNNTIGIRYSDAVNTGKWELFSQDNAGAEAVADLGITVAINTLYRIRIEIDKSKTEARAYINGEYAGRVTTSLPNSVANGCRAVIVKSVGTSGRTMNLIALSAGTIHL